MYLPLTLTIMAASALWSTYGCLTSDLFVVVPQSVGLLAGISQLALFIRSVQGFSAKKQNTYRYRSFITAVFEIYRRA